MATIKENGQTYLEFEGIQARKIQTGENDYKRGIENVDEYGEQHQDALATGDEKGKGTGDFGGHGWIRPDMDIDKNQRSGQFNTSEGGNSCDYKLRGMMLARSNYYPGFNGQDGREYGKDLIDTTANVRDGQYDGSIPTRIPYICPVF